MIEIVRNPNILKKYTFLCKICKTQWMCDEGDKIYYHHFIVAKCPICGCENEYYNFEQHKYWDKFKMGKGFYDIPILKGEKLK